MQIGTPDMVPVSCYLDVEQIIALAKEQKVDAIHPGYAKKPPLTVSCPQGLFQMCLE